MRLFCGLSPSGLCWRWFIYPKVLMQNDYRYERDDYIPFKCFSGTTDKLCSKEKPIFPINKFIHNNNEYLTLAKKKTRNICYGLKVLLNMHKNVIFLLLFQILIIKKIAGNSSLAKNCLTHHLVKCSPPRPTCVVEPNSTKATSYRVSYIGRLMIFSSQKFFQV